MVLVTNHIQNFYPAFTSKTISWKKGIRLKQNVVRLQLISHTDRCISQKHAFPLRSTSQCIRKAKLKPLRISSFKGNMRNDETGDASSKLVLQKNSVQTSSVQQSMEGTPTESPTAQDLPVFSAPESNKIRSSSQAIRALFMKWLNLMRNEAPDQAGDYVLEGSPQMDHVQEEKTENIVDRGEILKVVMNYFLGLDATITIPLLIFIPLYLGINLVYGTEVSRELTPLWIVGPLIVALYVKLVRWIIIMYTFFLKQTRKVVENLPTYYSAASNYIAEGKFNADINARFWQPMINIQSLGFKELSKRAWTAFKVWFTERYLDFVESIWPHYCRILRFLKGANLV